MYFRDQEDKIMRIALINENSQPVTTKSAAPEERSKEARITDGAVS